MIIEIKDLPPGQKIKKIQVDIEFDDFSEDSSEISSTATLTEVKPKKNVSNIKDVPEEMQIGEF